MHARGVMVAEVQHCLAASPQPPDAVLVGQAVEAARAAHLDAVGIGDARQLRHHARGLAPHHQPPRLALLAVEPELLGPGDRIVDKRLGVREKGRQLTGEVAAIGSWSPFPPGLLRVSSLDLTPYWPMGPRVCGLAAGGKRIRTAGPASPGRFG